MSKFKTKKIQKNPTHPTSPSSFQKRYIHEESDIFENEVISENISVSRKRKRIRIISGIFLILAVLAFFGVWGIQVIGNTRLSNNKEFEIFNPIISLIDNEDIKKQEKLPEKKGSKNILIAGIGGMGHPGGELTDSLMLANLNYDTKTVTLLSIPRDLYVAYSSNTAGKINALYPMGRAKNEGVNLLAKKVSEITGQPIHHFLIIDFSGFKSIVNALGGVEVDVPTRIYDREYPNNTWGYEIFSLEKGLQTLDGNAALKFARSRHSTSDFDRSQRQQLLLKAIKNKALSLGIITNPGKIGELIESVRDNLSTDLTVGQLVDIGLHFKDISNESIVMYSYNDQCSGKCLPGSYLYTPVRDNFGGAWVLLPETATKSRVSRYEEMKKFANLIFEYPHIQNAEQSIRIVTQRKNLTRARNLRKNLEQIGFPINHAEAIIQTGATITHSSIHSTYNQEEKTGFDENHILIQSLKKVDSNIPVTFSDTGKYTTGTTIEIIIGDDIKNYFEFTPPAITPNIGTKKEVGTKGNNAKSSNKEPESSLFPQQEDKKVEEEIIHEPDIAEFIPTLPSEKME